MEIYQQTQEINDRFGRSNLIVAIFPDEGSVKEKELVDDLESRSYVKRSWACRPTFRRACMRRSFRAA